MRFSTFDAKLKIKVHFFKESRVSLKDKIEEKSK